MRNAKNRVRPIVPTNVIVSERDSPFRPVDYSILAGFFGTVLAANDREVYSGCTSLDLVRRQKHIPLRRLPEGIGNLYFLNRRPTDIGYYRDRAACQFHRFTYHINGN